MMECIELRVNRFSAIILILAKLLLKGKYKLFIKSKSIKLSMELFRFAANTFLWNLNNYEIKKGEVDRCEKRCKHLVV